MCIHIYIYIYICKPDPRAHGRRRGAIRGHVADGLQREAGGHYIIVEYSILHDIIQCYLYV